MDKTNQLDIFEEKIAAKATILMQKDSVEIRLNPKIIVTSHVKCPYSLKKCGVWRKDCVKGVLIKTCVVTI